MSRIVLYTHDLEPITVLKLTPNMERIISTHDRMYVAVPEPLTVQKESDVLLILRPIRTIVIEVHWLRLGEHRKPLLVTKDEEDAMLLKSAFLPGQQRELNERRCNAIAEGFIKGIEAAGRYY